MLRFGGDVRVRYFSTQLHEMLACATLWSLLERVDVLVNSIDDVADARLATTLHGRSLAVDLDTAGDAPPDIARLAAYLRVVLPAPYDIVLERDHVHVEWDTRRGPLRAAPA